MLLVLNTVPVDCDINEVTGLISGKSWVMVTWMNVVTSQKLEKLIDSLIMPGASKFYNSFHMSTASTCPQLSRVHSFHVSTTSTCQFWTKCKVWAAILLECVLLLTSCLVHPNLDNVSHELQVHLLWLKEVRWHGVSLTGDSQEDPD